MSSRRSPRSLNQNRSNVHVASTGMHVLWKAGRSQLRDVLCSTLLISSDEFQSKCNHFDQALTHSSFSNETHAPDNQRLEFLGDAVLGLCVSEILIASFPHADEGELTRMRASLINAQSLSRWAQKNNLGAALALGKGAIFSLEQEQTNILADAVEAIVAAIYIDLGMPLAKRLVESIIDDGFHDASKLNAPDPKSQFQELAQGNHLGTPTYHEISVTGPAHARQFEVEVLIGQQSFGTGRGRSKKAAERQAASEAIVKLMNAPLFRDKL